jgi:hypothetical protein
LKLLKTTKKSGKKFGRPDGLDDEAKEMALFATVDNYF